MRRLVKIRSAVLGVVVIVEVMQTVLMMWAFHSGNPRALKLLTLYHKHVINPAMVRYFSGRSANAALLRHVGRRSGKAYATPLAAHRAEDTIIVALPFVARLVRLHGTEQALRLHVAGLAERLSA